MRIGRQESFPFDFDKILAFEKDQNRRLEKAEAAAFRQMLELRSNGKLVSVVVDAIGADKSPAKAVNTISGMILLRSADWL